MNTSPDSPTRRDFLRTSSTAAAVALAAPGIILRESAFAANTDTLKIGLVGCGGAGTGSRRQCAHCRQELRPDRRGRRVCRTGRECSEGTQGTYGNRVAVTPDTQFIGLDAYQKVIDSGVDVVLLASPPGIPSDPPPLRGGEGQTDLLRKAHGDRIRRDPPVMESREDGQGKKLNLVSGFCWRSDLPRRALYERFAKAPSAISARCTAPT